MAYVPPEIDAVTTVSKAVNVAVDLMQDTNGYVSVKMFFSDKDGIPRGLNKAPERTQAFPVINRVRQDTGVLAFETDDVSVELLRTGIANANGHEWGLINAVWWEQPITNPQARKRHGDKQYVVQLTYCAHPNVEGDKDLLMMLSRQTQDDLRVLARDICWGKVSIWNNANDGQRLTINLRSPKPAEVAPAKRLIVVRKGCLDIVPVAD